MLWQYAKQEYYEWAAKEERKWINPSRVTIQNYQQHNRIIFQNLDLLQITTLTIDLNQFYFKYPNTESSNKN